MKVVPFVATTFIRTLHATLRARHARLGNLENASPCIIALWHQHLLLSPHSRYRLPLTVIISRSKDGEIIAGVLRRYGVDSARGSSTRGGSAALRELIRESRAGKTIVFTPDGPKGPPRIAKDGVVWAARATGLPIVPLVITAKKKSCCIPGIG